MVDLVNRGIEYKRLKKGIEKVLKYTLKDVEDEGLRIRLLSKLIEVRELLDGARNST